MEKGKFNIRVGGGWCTSSFLIDVEGHGFGYDGFNFFVHKILGSGHAWTVSELETGCAVCTSVKKKDAVEKAKFLIDTKREAIENGIKKVKEYEEKHNTVPSS